MLGTDLVNTLLESGTETVGMDVEELDIRASGAVLDVLTRMWPDIVFNVAAMTDVDGCETSRAEAFGVNATGPENLARACRVTGALLVQLSTDYVFDGKGDVPYKEEDAPNPLGVYGLSKALGEKVVRELLPENHLIVRTQWLFGLHGRNFVENILQAAQEKDLLKVVDDQRGSPTYAPDLAAALVGLCERNLGGTFHITNSGAVSWHGFALKILETALITGVRVDAITSDELDRLAPRPPNSVLDNSKYVRLTGCALRGWEEGLADYVSKRGLSPNK